MLIICPVRPGDANEELRYALRSWEQNLLLDTPLELMVVGHAPPWLAPDHHVSGNLHDDARTCVWDNVLRGSRAASKFFVPPKTAIYMNDDFFCLDPVIQMPVYRRNKTLAEHLAMYPQFENQWFPQSLALTASWLSEAGFPHPDSYDLHRPLLASPRGMIEAMSRWEGDITGLLPQWRTVYGVLNQVEAIPVDDVKLGVPTSVVQGSPWVSTSDITWRKYGRNIAARFQKPSRWERDF